MKAKLTPEKVVSPEESASSRQEERRELRRQAIARRKALSDMDYERRSAAICKHLHENFPELAGMRLSFCWPVRREPDLRPLLSMWRNAGHASFAALLPVVVEEEAALAFRAWNPETPMILDRYGIPSPAAGEFLQPQALLVPLVAFDAAGYRLGYGGGFFDRTLALLRPRPLSIGVGFELSRVETIHPEPHDERLDAIVTEAGVFRSR